MPYFLLDGASVTTDFAKQRHTSLCSQLRRMAANRCKFKAAMRWRLHEIPLVPKSVKPSALTDPLACFAATAMLISRRMFHSARLIHIKRLLGYQRRWSIVSRTYRHAALPRVTLPILLCPSGSLARPERVFFKILQPGSQNDQAFFRNARLAVETSPGTHEPNSRRVPSSCRARGH